MNPVSCPPRLDALLTEREAAVYLKLSRITLSIWRSKHQGPPYLKLGHRTVRYRLTDLIDWADARSVKPA